MASSNQPDTIILARRVHTFAGKPASAQAIALRNGRVATLGQKKKILELKGRDTRVIDLGDKTITPGLVDSHTHFFYWALYRRMLIDVGPATSLDETLHIILNEARDKQVGGWVLGTGFDYNPWSEGAPTARDLDRALPDLPAIIRSRDQHTAWINTAAMEQIGLTRLTPDPKGGRFARDADGNPTGIVHETAVKELPTPINEFTARNDSRALRRIDTALDEAYEIAWSYGITSVHSMDDAPSLRHFQRHHRDKRLGIRIVHAIQVDSAAAAAELGLSSGLGDDWLRLGGIKIFSDGTLGSQTAYMFDDYPGREGYIGVPVVAGEDLRSAVIDAAHHGFPVWIHAIGDRAAAESLSAIGAARRFEEHRLPHRIEHAQCVRPADIRRMAKGGVFASVQPCHLIGDISTAETHWPQSKRNAFAYRKMLDAGVTLAMGSDLPIETIDPRRSLHAAVQRQDENCSPAKGWHPSQRLSVEETLRGFTIGAHASVRVSDPAHSTPIGGVIAPGAAADFTVWDKDPMTADPESLLEIGIAGCIIDGVEHLS